MAVFEHIHSDREWLFPKIAEASDKFIITIEDEESISWKHFHRHYKKIFEAAGLKQIDFQDCKNEPFHQGFYFRKFEK